MDLSRRDWALAVLGALALHLLLLTGIWLTQQPAPSPKNTPRGIMVSLDNLNAGPPPPASIQDMPIENVAPNNTVGPAPAPAAPAANSAQAPAAPAPAAAPEVGPEPSDQPPLAPSGGGPGQSAHASSSPNGPSAATPAIASAVTIRPRGTLEDIQPQQTITAHNARLSALEPTANAPKQYNGASGNSEQATQSYIVRLRGWLARHKTYPQVARRQKIEGTVRLYLVVNRKGQVVAHHIEAGSNAKILDTAVEQMLAHSEPLPRMPAAMQRNRLTLVIPVIFTLH